MNTVLQDAMEQAIYRQYAAARTKAILDELFALLAIHTGVRPGNRKMRTYSRYLQRKGWRYDELVELVRPLDNQST